MTVESRATGFRRRLAVGLALVIGLAVFSLALRDLFTSRFPGGNDLYPRWAAGCGWLERGEDPYDPQTTLQIQRGIYGREALPGEDQVAFAYPIYSVLLTWPLCLAQGFASAHAFAMTALILAVILTAAGSKALSGVAVGPGRWAWVVGWIVLAYPSMRGILLGQLAVGVSLLQVAVLLAILRGRDPLAGVALALSTIKPQMALLFVPWILLWSASQRRWSLWAGFGGSLLVFVLVPMIWLPDWLSGWVGQLRAYPGYTEFGSGAWILTSHLLGTSPWVEGVLTAGLAGWVALVAVRSRTAPFRSALWTTSLVLVMTHFLSPRTATTHFSSLLVPLFLLASLWDGKGGGDCAGRILALILPAFGIGSWVLFLTTVQGRQESALNYLPIPLLLLAGLLRSRKAWERLAQAGA